MIRLKAQKIYIRNLTLPLELRVYCFVVIINVECDVNQFTLSATGHKYCNPGAPGGYLSGAQL